MHRTTDLSSSRLSSRLAVASSLMVLACGLAGCGAVDSYDKAISDAWAVTYEIEVSGGGGTLDAVSYLESEKRGDPGSPVEVENAMLVVEGKDSSRSSWSVDSIITAQAEAAVTATPGEGSTATCRILLDGRKAIATQTGAPGEPVECTAITPAFER